MRKRGNATLGREGSGAILMAMREVEQRPRLLAFLLLNLSAVSPTGAGAQGVPSEQAVPPPIAEWDRGFTSITSIRELDVGRTLVADHGEDHLYLVNWETGDMNEVLRRGEGPGEHGTIRWLYAVGEDETLLTSGAFRWILLRDNEAAQTFTGTAPLNRRFRNRLDGVVPGIGVLASVSAERPGFAGANVRVLELAPGLRPYDELPRLDTIGYLKGGGRYQLACSLAVQGPPACHFLEAEDQAVLFPDGWIAVALQNPYHVEWRAPDGEWTRGEPLARGSAAPVTEAEKCAAINGWAEDGTECGTGAIEGYLWPDTIPPFLTDSRLCPACRELVAGGVPWLFTDPRGRLVVRRTPQLSRRENRYDIIDRSGRLVERVTLPINEAIVGFGESNVYTIRVDEVDLQWLRRHPWRE